VVRSPDRDGSRRQRTPSDHRTRRRSGTPPKSDAPASTSRQEDTTRPAETSRKYQISHERFVKMQDNLAGGGEVPKASNMYINPKVVAGFAEAGAERPSVVEEPPQRPTENAQVPTDARWQVVARKQGPPPQGQQDPPKVIQTRDQGGMRKFNEAHKGSHTLHTWSVREIRFHAVGVRDPLTKEQWRPLQTQLRAAHAIWSNIYNAQNEDKQTVKINNPMWDSVMGCGVITLPEGAIAKKIRDGFIPQLQLPIQLRASVKEDMRVPVLKTTMPDDLYAAFKTEEHVEHLKQYNPIFGLHPFVQHKCYRIDRARVLQIKTSEEVVKYVQEKNFVVPYPSGEVYFQREIHWTAATAVCTLPVAAPAPSSKHHGSSHGQGAPRYPSKPPLVRKDMGKAGQHSGGSSKPLDPPRAQDDRSHKGAQKKPVREVASEARSAQEGAKKVKQVAPEDRSTQEGTKKGKQVAPEDRSTQEGTKKGKQVAPDDRSTREGTKKARQVAPEDRSAHRDTNTVKQGAQDAGVPRIVVDRSKRRSAPASISRPEGAAMGPVAQDVPKALDDGHQGQQQGMGLNVSQEFDEVLKEWDNLQAASQVVQPMAQGGI